MAPRHDGAGDGIRWRRSEIQRHRYFCWHFCSLWELAAASRVDQCADRSAARAKILGIFSELVWSGQIPMQILAQHEARGGGLFSRRGSVYSIGDFHGIVPTDLSLASKSIVEMLRPVPPPVVIPVALLFFGLDDEMKIFVIFFSCAWPILLNTIDGVRGIDWVLLNTAKTFGLSRGKTIWHVILPAALAADRHRSAGEFADHADSRGDLGNGRQHRRHRLFCSRCPAPIQSRADVCGHVRPGAAWATRSISYSI